MDELEHGQRPGKGVRHRIDQDNITSPVQIALTVGFQLVEIALGKPILIRTIGARPIQELPFRVQHDPVVVAVTHQQVRFQAEPALSQMANQMLGAGLGLEHQRLGQLFRKMLGDKSLENRLHGK